MRGEEIAGNAALRQAFATSLEKRLDVRRAEFAGGKGPGGRPPGEISPEEHLFKTELVTREDFGKAAEEFFGTAFASPDDFPKEPMLFDHLSVQFMKESKFIPAQLENNVLTVIMNNPADFYARDAIRLATNHEVRVLLGNEDDIVNAIERSYGSGATSMEKIIEDMEGIPEYQAEDEANVDHLRDMASEGPVIRLVNLIITRAIERRASDIHFEPFEDHFRVRYRIDGVLHKPGDTTTVRQYVDVDPTTLNTEFIKVQSQFIRNHVNPMVIVKADKDARYGTIKKIMDTLQDININRFSLMTEIERRQAPASPGSAG